MEQQREGKLHGNVDPGIWLQHLLTSASLLPLTHPLEWDVEANCILSGKAGHLLAQESGGTLRISSCLGKAHMERENRTKCLHENVFLIVTCSVHRWHCFLGTRRRLRNVLCSLCSQRAATGPEILTKAFCTWFCGHLKARLTITGKKQT